MDPNETISSLRRLSTKVIELDDRYDDGEITRETWAIEMGALAVEQAELFQALDEWMKTRGFLPTDWQR